MFWIMVKLPLMHCVLCSLTRSYRVLFKSRRRFLDPICRSVSLMIFLVPMRPDKLQIAGEPCLFLCCLRFFDQAILLCLLPETQCMSFKLGVRCPLHHGCSCLTVDYGSPGYAGDTGLRAVVPC